MIRKIISDSACDYVENLLENETKFAKIPFTISFDDKNYLDNNTVDIEQVINELKEYKGKSSSACPGPFLWENEAKEADEIFFVTIASGVSGSYNAALVAKEMLLDEDENKKVHVINSLSSSGLNALIVLKLEELIKTDKNFEEICNEIDEYTNKLKTNFMFLSIENFVKNGRVSKVVGAATAMLNIAIIGENTKEGTLGITQKVRGVKKGLQAVFEEIKKQGYKGGKAIITHCQNEINAINLKEMILKEFKNAEILIEKTGLLCSYYAEKGGVIIGYEK